MLKCEVGKYRGSICVQDTAPGEAVEVDFCYEGFNLDLRRFLYQGIVFHHDGCLTRGKHTTKPWLIGVLRLLSNAIFSAFLFSI